MRTPEPRTVAVVLVDGGGVIRYWSEGAQSLTGHLAADVVGSPLDVIVPPAYRERHWAGFRAAMDSATARLEGASANLPVLCADGSIRRWPGRFSLIRDAHGGAAGAAAVLMTPVAGDPPLFDL
jgi:PAS domain S-box-containing protein